MADTMRDLLSCPFCEGEAWLREETIAPKDCRNYIQCRQCGVATALQPTPEIAVMAWNTRTHHAEIDAMARDAARWKKLNELFDHTKTSEAERIFWDLGLGEYCATNDELNNAIDAAPHPQRQGEWKWQRGIKLAAHAPCVHGGGLGITGLDGELSDERRR